MKPWLRVAEAAEYTGLSRDTIYTACERGRASARACRRTTKDSPEAPMDRRVARAARAGRPGRTDWRRRRRSRHERHAARSAHRGRSGRSSAHNTPRHLRDDRAPATPRRDPCSPASAPARRRFARLAEPEARAIARGVTGDERHNPSVSERRLGGRHPCRRT